MGKTEECPVCGKRFSVKNMANHVFAVHLEEKRASKIATTVIPYKSCFCKTVKLLTPQHLREHLFEQGGLKEDVIDGKITNTKFMALLKEHYIQYVMGGEQK